jgi:hypothetical protein
MTRPAIIVRMSDENQDRPNFEEIARTLADEMRRALERVSEIDVDELTRTASTEAERARAWFEEIVGRWGDGTAWSFGFGDDRPDPDDPRDPAAAPAPAHDPDAADPLGHAGPSPLDLPTGDQGLALAALDSGRWRLEPGTSAFVVFGEGPSPRDALGLVRELRVRDWMSADGEITLAGRHALKRWLEGAGSA